MNTLMFRTLPPALALSVVFTVASATKAQTITQVSGLDSISVHESETACAVSVFPDRQVEVIAANDTVEGGGFFYSTDNRYAVYGASFMGWFARERTASDPNPAWQHGHIEAGTGAAADVAALWGDPGLASAPEAPGTALLTSLMIPAGKFPPPEPDNEDKQDCFDNGVAFGCVTVPQSGDCSNLGGTCVARSNNGGLSFTLLDCFGDTSPAACADGDEFDSTLGHFYDGMDVAIGYGSSPPGYVAMRDVETSKEALWKIDDATTGTEFHQVVDATGPLGQLGAALENILSHVRLRVDTDNRVWRMGYDDRTVTLTDGSATKVRDLKVALLDSNLDAKVVADDMSQAKALRVNGVPRALNDTFDDMSDDLRFGPEFDFDVGKNENGEDEMRFVYLAGSDSNTYVQAGRCASDLSASERPARWRSTIYSSAKQMHPSIKYGYDSTVDRHIWKVSYYELNTARTEIAVFAGDLAMVSEPGGGNLIPARLVADAVTPFSAPCPDQRDSFAYSDSLRWQFTNDDYWGDYDDMFFNSARCSFTRSYTDSSQGCTERKAYTSTHQHVSAVEIACCADDRQCGGGCCVGEEVCIDEGRSACAVPDVVRSLLITGNIDLTVTDENDVDYQFSAPIDRVVNLSPDSAHGGFTVAVDTAPITAEVGATFDLLADGMTVNVYREGFFLPPAFATNPGDDIAAGASDSVGGSASTSLPSSNLPYTNASMQWSYTVVNSTL